MEQLTAAMKHFCTLLKTSRKLAQNNDRFKRTVEAVTEAFQHFLNDRPAFLHPDNIATYREQAEVRTVPSPRKYYSV